MGHLLQTSRNVRPHYVFGEVSERVFIRMLAACATAPMLAGRRCMWMRLPNISVRWPPGYHLLDVTQALDVYLACHRWVIGKQRLTTMIIPELTWILRIHTGTFHDGWSGGSTDPHEVPELHELLMCCLGIEIIHCAWRTYVDQCDRVAPRGLTWIAQA